MEVCFPRGGSPMTDHQGIPLPLLKLVFLDKHFFPAGFVFGFVGFLFCFGFVCLFHLWVFFCLFLKKCWVDLVCRHITLNAVLEAHVAWPQQISVVTLASLKHCN